jgi:hypothetical protein
MATYKKIDDRNSEILPSITKLRASQAKGAADEGMNETDCRELNATQGHIADIKEFTDAERQCAIIRRGMMANQDADPSRMDDVNRKDWPEGEEI